jgi:hypothetical protein
VRLFLAADLLETVGGVASEVCARDQFREQGSRTVPTKLRIGNARALSEDIGQHIQVSKTRWRSVENEQQETVGGGWGFSFCAAEVPTRFHFALRKEANRTNGITTVLRAQITVKSFKQEARGREQKSLKRQKAVGWVSAAPAPPRFLRVSLRNPQASKRCKRYRDLFSARIPLKNF